MLIYLLNMENEEIVNETLECIEYLLMEKANIPLFLSCLMEEDTKDGNKLKVLREKL